MSGHDSNHADHTAPGVAYTTYPGTDLRLFRCDRLSATLSTDACAQRHRDAQSATGDHLDRLIDCRSCPIGAAHAGTTLIHYSWLYGSEICPRCGKGTTRMIHGRRCISCYNREREVLSGQNGKRRKPIYLRPVAPIELHYITDGEPRRIQLAQATGLVEAMAHVLRTTPGDIVFHRHRPNAVTR